jgi:hypothetical protein
MKGWLLFGSLTLCLAAPGFQCKRVTPAKAASLREDACLNIAHIKQGVKGQIHFQSGNFMPGPDAKGGKTEPVQRRVFIFPVFRVVGAMPGGFLDSSLAPAPVFKGPSCPDGTFGAALPPGSYSVMVMEKGRLYANGMDGMGNVNPVEIMPGKITEITLNINYQAVY